jgi:hypothetical protein
MGIAALQRQKSFANKGKAIAGGVESASQLP